MRRVTKSNKLDLRDTQQEVSFSIALSKGDVTIKKYGQYATLLLQGGAPRAEPGEPALPWKKHFVAVPKGAIPKEVKIGQMRVVPLARNVTVEPCQPSIPTVVGAKVCWVPPNSKVYASGKPLPKSRVELVGIRQLGDLHMAEIAFCPFKYQPRARSLDIVEHVDLTLTFALGARKRRAKTLGPAAWRQAQYYAQRVRGLVLNPQDVTVDESLQEDRAPTPTPTPTPAPPLPLVDHVIVTTLALAQDFQRLAAWRTGLGLRSRVVTVEDIIAGSVPDTGEAVFWHSAGYYDGGTRDVAEAIRNFVKWANTNWAARYVLLGGDTDIIPVRKALHTAVGTAPYMELTGSDTSAMLGSSPLASSAKAGSLALSVTDADPATLWECDSTDANPWIRLIMPAHTPVNRVDLQWGANHAIGYRIEVSDDETNWTSLYTTSNAPGGTEQITFACTSARFLRLLITSGTAFALGTMRIYGPSHHKYAGCSYRQGTNVTRIYLGVSLGMNPANSPDSDLILIQSGPHSGTVVPYDINANPTTLGWFFVDDLISPQPTAAADPTRFVEIRGPAEFHGNDFVLKTDLNYIATDLYYSGILSSEYPVGNDHDWDRDRNLVYGEQYSGSLDGVNGMSDAFVGRAPVETSAEAEVFIDKIMRYERFVFLDQQGNEAVLGEDFAVSVLLGSQDWALSNTVGLLDYSARGKETIRNDLLTEDNSRWRFTRLYQDFADVPATDQGADLAVASSAAILAAIAAGQNFVSLSSHGSPGYLCYLSSGNVDDEPSPPAIWYGNACSTNKFDTPSGEAISELAMMNPAGAAVAYVGNSRFGWTSDNPVERAFWAELFVSGELGRMLAAAHTMGTGWTRYSLNLLGDPALRVWSDRPLQISVTHASSVFLGLQTIPPSAPSQDFEVRVSTTSDGSPVEGASVCLVQGDSLFVTGTTDSSGLVRLAISPTEPGIMRVSVCGRDLIPYFGSVNVRRSMVCCTLQIKCGPRVSCTNILSCPERINCALPVNCRPLVTCGPRILCQQHIVCNNYVACGSLISCSVEVSCKSRILCGPDIACASAIACGMSIGGCARLRPGEFDILWQAREIWGIGDIDELVERFDSPQVRETFDRLPPELKKPIRMMVERIRRDVSRS